MCTVGGRGPVVHVEHEEVDDDGQGYKDHGEEQVLADRRGITSEVDGMVSVITRRNTCQGEEHRDAEGHLLTAVGRQVKTSTVRKEMSRQGMMRLMVVHAVFGCRARRGRPVDLPRSSCT